MAYQRLRPALSRRSQWRFDVGRDGGIRTHGCRSQSPVPYRLATSLFPNMFIVPTPKRRRHMGWVKGLEPSTPGTTIRCSNQLSYTHHISRRSGFPASALARQEGFEPPTYCLEGSCSIQLSYWRTSQETRCVPFPAAPKASHSLLPCSSSKQMQAFVLGKGLFWSG